MGMTGHPWQESPPKACKLGRRLFDNQKLLMYNYLQNALKMEIYDLVLLTKTVFIMLTSPDYERLPHKTELAFVLGMILEKITFLVPANDDLVEMVSSIFGTDLIEHVQTTAGTGSVRVSVKVNPQRKPEFFRRFKRVFDDITSFFKITCDQDFRFQFS